MIPNPMLYAILALWVFGAICILRERQNTRMLMYLFIFSLVVSLIYFVLGSPDTAMAEAAISAFTTIFFIVCFEKYEALKVDGPEPKQKAAQKGRVWRVVAPLLFVAVIGALIFYFSPAGDAIDHLKSQYLVQFTREVGGENAVTAIYLGYRVYDTLFEALLLVVTVLAVAHMSYSTSLQSEKQKRYLKPSVVEITVIQAVAVVMLLFGVYLIANGHMTAGGGFQGGLLIAAFFICRFLIHNIYDLPIHKLFRLEEFIFASTVVIAVFVIFIGIADHLPAEHLSVFQGAYMVIMNALIGLKVACGFIILFYRYVTIERR